MASGKEENARPADIINPTNDSALPTRVKADEALVAATGRKHIIVSGITIGTCATFPTLSLLNDGYKVYPVIDACGAWNVYEAQAAMERMSRAGAELETVFALGCELQADWKLPSANSMLGPFIQHLPEYAFIVQNFWNNANRHVVPDPSRWSNRSRACISHDSRFRRSDPRWWH